MDVLVQDAPCVAGYLPYGQPDAQLIVTIAVKATFAVVDGMLIPDPNQIPLWEGDQEWEGWPVLTDLTPLKAGCDLIVLGDAVPPGTDPVPMMNVDIRVGAFARPLLVWGDRRWQRGPDGWRPSPPIAFSRMPLRWERAYGGASRSPIGEHAVSGNNPIGRGFQLIDDAGILASTNLPNVEFPGLQMKTWSDTPDPAGCGYYPATWGLRLRNGVEVGADGAAQVKPVFFNQAHPSYILEDFPEGERLVISGMTGDGPFVAPLSRPKLKATMVSVLGSSDELPLRWDTVCAIPSQARVFMIGRCAFRYDPDVHWASEVHISPQAAAEAKE